MLIREIAQNYHNFARNISRRFPSFSLLLPNFFHCFCPNFGKKQWEIRAKAMGKLGKRRGGRAKIIAFARIPHMIAFSRISIASARIFYCFFLNFPLILPEFPTAFARILRFQFFGGAQCPPASPPPTPMRVPICYVQTIHFINHNIVLVKKK